MKILVTGFSPFGGEKINPSFEAVRLLPDMIGSAEIIKAEIPTSFKKSEEEIRRLFDLYYPEIILAVGQAGGRNGISVEKVAVNKQIARIPDNDGCQPDGIPVDGETDCFELYTDFDAERIVSDLNEHGITASVSLSAGTYVCNSLFFNILSITHKHKGIIGGFIHVPYCSDQLSGKPSDTPSMTLSEISEALRVSLLSIISFYDEKVTPNPSFDGCERLILESKTGSTNDDAKRMIRSGYKENALIIADYQTKGRGRLGRSFYSPLGSGLYMSCVFPIDDFSRFMTLTPAAAVAVCRAIEKLTPHRSVGIKWVNDIFIDNKKAAGILAEPVSDENGNIVSVVVGIGINTGSSVFPPELENIAVSIGDVDRFLLAKEIFLLLKDYIGRLPDPEIMKEYGDRSILTGKKIQFFYGDKTGQGTVIGTDESGALIVDDGKETMALKSGEITVRLHE
ncbi:MAG: biotin--[acetyl-CoA-carboxylase] ligase [Clostridia bacterium]|nr:biotin--[acetyl-CoA-carboxylase] ligase [Clostridia bacterium]